MSDPAFALAQSRSHRWETLSQAAEGLSRAWSAHRLLPAGPERATHLRTLELPQGATVNRLAFDAAVQVHPLARADVLLLQMPLRGTASVCIDGRTLTLHAGCCGVTQVTRMSHAAYEAGFEMLVLRVPMDGLARQLEAWLDRPLRGPLRFDPLLMAGSPAWSAWAPMRAALQALDEAASPQGLGIAMASLHGAVVATLLHGLPHDQADDLQRPARRLAPACVKRAEAFMREHLGAPLTLPRIAQRVGVSPRSLFDGFLAAHAMTPAQFLRRMRLQMARDALSRGQDSVADVAGRCGFLHAGRFAFHYKRQFGESPSQTPIVKIRPRVITDPPAPTPTQPGCRPFPAFDGLEPANALAGSLETA